MRQFLIALTFLFLFPISIHAENSCIETRDIQTKVMDKAIDIFDRSMPMLFHDPQQSILFHLSRSKQYYESAKTIMPLNSARAMRLAAKGQNQLTLLEKNIRNIRQKKTVPYDKIFTTLEEVSSIQTALDTAIPESCATSFKTLESFQKRTVEGIKKLYYESLLP